MQARESLGSLSELFTPMLGEEAAAIGAHAPDASPEDKLADDIKKVIAEESAKIRTTSMTTSEDYTDLASIVCRLTHALHRLGTVESMGQPAYYTS